MSASRYVYPRERSPHSRRPPVDLFLTDDGGVVLNGVNTFPGLTSYSRYPRMMAAAGIPLAAVLDRLIAFAMERRP